MKSVPTALARMDKRFQSKDTHKGSFLIQRLNYLGKEWELSAQGGTWEPLRLQEVRLLKGGEGGTSSQPRRKEKALYFLFILPGRKRKLPKPRPQYIIGQTQGTWFELTERESPSPRRHTRKSYDGLFPGGSTAIHPASLGHSPTATKGPPTGRGSSSRRRHRHGRADLFLRLGALQEWGGARKQDLSFNVPSERLNH